MNFSATFSWTSPLSGSKVSNAHPRSSFALKRTGASYGRVNINSFLKENIKSSDTRDKVKTTRTVKKTTTTDLIRKKQTLHVQHTFFLISKKTLHVQHTCF